MILKKVLTGLFFVLLLNGCLQTTALLGPASTLAYTGSVYEAGLSYGTSKAVKKVTGKSTTQNIKDFLKKKNEETKEKENYDEVFALVKSRINKTHKIIFQIVQFPYTIIHNFHTFSIKNQKHAGKFQEEKSFLHNITLDILLIVLRLHLFVHVKV